MNSRDFVNSVQQKLEPIAPIILPGIIKKQLMEVRASRDNLTPEQAEEFIKRMVEAMEFFLGPEGARMVRQMMTKELRRCAPEYFEKHALI
jgi:hypothetical protein